MDIGDDDLDLIKEEAMRESLQPRARSNISNPFRLPAESEVFGGREMDKRRRNNERASMMQMTLIQRANNQRPTVPPCITKPSPIMHPASSLSSSSGRDPKKVERTKRMTEFVHEKREIYLIQMIIDKQRKEIKRILGEMKRSEEDAIEQENNIETQSKKYKLCHAQNEATLARCRRKAETAAQQRVDLQRELKRASQAVHSMKSEIIKNQDTLETFHVYREFLDQMTPEGEDTAKFFNTPEKMTECLHAIEEGNLSLISACQYYDNKLDGVTKGFTRRDEETRELEADVREEIAKIPTVEEIPENADEVIGGEQKIQEVEYDRVKALVVHAYVNCFGKTADISPLSMLQRIEYQIEEYYRKIDYVSPDFVAAKQQQFDKVRREEQRKEKQKRQEAEQKLKMEQAIERANRPIPKKTGRPIVARTYLSKHMAKDDDSRLQALKEQQRIENLLYGEITD